MKVFFKNWVTIPRNLHKGKHVINFLKNVKIYPILRNAHYKTLDWVLALRYGKNFIYDHIGKISVQGISFKFYDPQHRYLPKIFFGENYEEAVIHHLKSVIGQKKLCFLDIGAHYGYFTIFAGKSNKNCTIYAFEPNKEAFRVLNENIKINKIKSKQYEIALSDNSGKIPFSDRSMKVKGKRDIVSVNSTPFDKLRNKEKIYPDVVKIDVHGSEGKVLFGMKKALKNDIKHLYLELHSHNELAGDYSMKEIIDLLYKSGFELFEMQRFRKAKTPKFIKITDSFYNDLVNEDRWLKLKKDSMPMIYATKGD